MRPLADIAGSYELPAFLADRDDLLAL